MSAILSAILHDVLLAVRHSSLFSGHKHHRRFSRYFPISFMCLIKIFMSPAPRVLLRSLATIDLYLISGSFKDTSLIKTSGTLKLYRSLFLSNEKPGTDMILLPYRIEGVEEKKTVHLW